MTDGKGGGESGEATFKPETLTSELTTGSNNDSSADRPQRARGRPAGSKSRRATPKTAQLPKVDVPLWFIENGVTLREDNILDPASRKLGIAPYKPETELPPSNETPREKSPEEVEADNAEFDKLLKEIEEEKKHPYWLNETTWKEIVNYVQAGLTLPKASFLDSFAAMKSNCILHYPRDGAIYCLDAVVERVAADVGADLIRIDAQDLEEIAGDFLGDSRHRKPY